MVVAWISALLLAAEGDWALEQLEDDGTTIEGRAVSESSLPELRVTAHADAAPSALSAAAWELRNAGVLALYLEAREVLRETSSLRLVSMRVHPPLVGARQCVLMQQRSYDEGSGSARVWYRMLRPHGTGEHRPFAQLHGEWRFEPDPTGGTHVTYTTLVDVGGVPAWLAKGPQRNAALATVREIIARAGQL
jgi:hypothetical protein